MHIPRPRQHTAGLSMLLGGEHTPGHRRLVEIPVGQVVRNERQPRTTFDPAAIVALAASIEANGVIQPIVVRERPDGLHEIVAGERRWLAARQAGLRTVPALIQAVDDCRSLVLALAENLVREDINALEAARAYATLLDEHELNVAELARAVGKSRPAVANTLRLLELPDEIQLAIEEGRLTEGHGRALLAVTDRGTQRALARHAVEHGLSVRSLEALSRVAADKEPANKRKTMWNNQPSPELEARIQRIASGLPGGRGRVKLGSGAAKLELISSDPQALFDLAERIEATLSPR